MLGRLACVTPHGELTRNDLLNRLAVRKIDRAAPAGADEVSLVQGQALGERWHLDKAAQAFRRGGRDGEPVPTPLDDLAQSAHGDALEILRQRCRVANEVARAGGFALASHPDDDRRGFLRARALPLKGAPVEEERDASRIVGAQDLREGSVKERLKVPAKGALDEPGIEQGGERVCRRETHGRSAPSDQPWRWDPSPRRLVTRRQTPGRGDVMLAPHSLGHHVGADEQRDLDTNTSEADAGAADLRARRDVVVARQRMPTPSSTMVRAGAVGSVVIVMAAAPESRALATISVRTVSSVDAG